MDTKTIGLIGTAVKVIIALLGAVFCVLIISNSESIKLGENVGFLDSAMVITYIAMFICIAVALLFGLYKFATNIGKSKGMLFSLIGFAAILGISYAVADDSVTMAWQDMGVTESVSKMTSMGLTATFVLLGLAVIAALLSEVTKLIK